MPIEVDVVSLGLLLLAVLVATAGGGLVGRRIRGWRERRAERTRLAAVAAVGAAGRADERAPSPTGARVAAGTAVATTAVAASTAPPPSPASPAVAAAGFAAPPAAPAAAGTARFGVAPPPSTAGGPTSAPTFILDERPRPTTELGRRLAGTPPPVAARPLAGRAAAAEAIVDAGATGTPPSHRGRRIATAGALGGASIALALYALAGGFPIPQWGSVLQATGQPDETFVDGGSGAGGLLPGDPSATAGAPPPAGGSPAPGTPAGAGGTPGPRPNGGAAGAGGTPTGTPAPTARPRPGTTSAPTPAPTRPPTPGPTGTPAPTPRPTPAPTDTPAPTPEPTPTPTATPKPLVITFTWVPDGLTVAFAGHTTKPPCTWQWDLGDGTGSTRRNPTHTYDQAGTYDVRLTGTCGGASDTYRENVTVAP